MFFQRKMKQIRSRWKWGRKHIPFWLVHRIQQGSSLALQARTSLTLVAARSPYTNVYYCGTIKSGSQWLCSMFSDIEVYRYSGLRFYDFIHRYFDGREPRFRMTERPYHTPFPPHTLTGTFCIDYASFQTIPKPDQWRAFFVHRDPRDLVVSWYYSSRISHIVLGKDTLAVREALLQRNLEDGLCYAIDWLANYGMFASLASWRECRDPNVKLVHYEDLISEEAPRHFTELFDFIGVQMPPAVQASLLEAYSFRTLSGREKGQGDNQSHVRKGVAGDGKAHFTDKVEAHFREVVGEGS